MHTMSTKAKVILLGIGIFLVAETIGNMSSPKTAVEGTQTVVPTVEVTITPTDSPTPTDTPAPTTYTAPQTYDNTQTTTSATDQSTGLSNDNYYTNSSGNQVHSPAYSNNGDVPAGATAMCADGTYSFSQHRSGTCSHHGGVAQWY